MGTEGTGRINEGRGGWWRLKGMVRSDQQRIDLCFRVDGADATAAGLGPILLDKRSLTGVGALQEKTKGE